MRADRGLTGRRGPIGRGALVGIASGDQLSSGLNGHGYPSLHFGLGEEYSACGTYAAAFRPLNWFG